MRSDHIEQVLTVLKTIYIELPQEERVRRALANLELAKGRPKKRNTEPRERWIEEARAFAREYIRTNGVVNIHIIRDHLPLPPGVDERATGGVLKHPDFVKVRDKPVKKSGGRIKTIGEYTLAEEDEDDDYGYVRFD